MGGYSLNCLEKNRTNTFGKIKERRDPIWGCLTRRSILKFKKYIYAGQKQRAWGNSSLRCYFISRRLSHSGKWIPVEERQWYCIYTLAIIHRLPVKWWQSTCSTAFCLSTRRAGTQIQGSTPESNNVNYSKDLESEVKLPTKYLGWPPSCRDWELHKATDENAYIKLNEKKSRPTTLIAAVQTIEIFHLVSIIMRGG